MAKISYVNVPAGLQDKFFLGLAPTDRFNFPHLSVKNPYLSVKRKKGLSQRSLMPQVSELWASLSSEEKTAWANAGHECGLSGWQDFLAEQCARIKNQISGTGTPSTLHQGFVGNLHIDAPADGIWIAQFHPNTYWVSRKVAGTKAQYAPVLVNENIALPLTISCNYKSELAQVGDYHDTFFYAILQYSYQGVTRSVTANVTLDLTHDWVHVSAPVPAINGYIVGYTLYFFLGGVTGDLYFDNVKVEHSGQNWARDPHCKNINQGFTRMFFQVPSHWVPLDLPTGSFLQSIYKNF